MRPIAILLSASWLLLQGSCEPEPFLENLTQFEKTYGGVSEDVAMDAILFNNQLIITGKISTGGSSDMLLLKTDLDGNELWQRNFGGSDFQSATSLIRNTTGEFLIVGNGIDLTSSDNDIILVKTDSEGNQLWKSSVPSPNDDLGMDVVQVDGGYVVCGGDLDSNRDVLLAKFSESGELQWTKTYGGPMNDAAWKVLNTGISLLIYGFTESYGAGSRDTWILETDLNGDSIASTTIGSSEYETAGSLVESGSGFYLCGHSAATEPNHEMHIAKLSSGMTVEWERHFGFSNGHDGGEDLVVDNGTIYAVGVSAGSNGQSDDGFFVKLSDNGALISDTLIGGVLNDQFNAVLTSETSVYLFGSTNSAGAGDNDIWIVKMPK